MKLLAIDTSTEIASLALQTENTILTAELSGQRQHAQSLLGLIDNLCKEAQVPVYALEGIVFGQGPGSFTGLRVAASMAKGLAYARDLPLYPVSSLQAIAVSLKANHPDMGILAVIDARMHELYWAYYPAVAKSLVKEWVSPASAIEISQNENILLAGVGFEHYTSDFSPELTAKITRQLVTYPKASDMIAMVNAGQIKPVTASAARPVYIRNKVTQGGQSG